MNMKKVLAAVLAVMLAISAMAITAFADEYTINLSSASTWSKGNAYSTVEFTIPVYAKYGYAIEGNAITLNLPTTYTLGDYEVKASYAVVVNGTSYALGVADGADSDTYTIYDNTVSAIQGTATVVCDPYVVSFGALTHSWDGASTVIPQSAVVGDNASLTVIGTYSVVQDSNKVIGNNVYADLIKVTASDFGYYTDASQNNYHTAKFTTKFWDTQHFDNVNATYTYTYNGETKTDISYCWTWNAKDAGDIAAPEGSAQASLIDRYWNATLANKAAVLSADTAKVVVTLDRAIVGNYYFGLIATYSNGVTYDLVNNIPSWALGNKYAAYVEITEPTSVIEFEIDTEVLYSTTYGIFNEKMDVKCIDTAHEAALTTVKTLKTSSASNGVYSGTIGKYSWDSNGIYFCGEAVNEYWNQWSNAEVSSVDIVLTIGDDAAEDVELDVPVESETEEVDEDNTDVEVDDKNDENPTTGIALAIVPMMVAAAAVVASKRR